MRASVRKQRSKRNLQKRKQIVDRAVAARDALAAKIGDLTAIVDPLPTGWLKDSCWASLHRAEAMMQKASRQAAGIDIEDDGLDRFELKAILTDLDTKKTTAYIANRSEITYMASR